MLMAKKLPKLKKGAWFYKIRGSYLPATPEGWLMHSFLLLCGVCVLIIAAEDTRSLSVVLTTATLQLIGLGAIFSWVASHHY